MSENFVEAKKKREHFESHNDNAVELVEDLLKSKDSKDRDKDRAIKESLDRITKALDKLENDKKQESLLNEKQESILNEEQESLLNEKRESILNEKQKSLLNSLVLKLAHSRDNNLIERFLKHLDSSREGTNYGTPAFHAMVLKLTVNDDCHTLDTVLRYGRAKKLEPEFSGENPIVIASEQVSHLLTIFSMQYTVIVFRDIFSAQRSCMVLDTGSMDQS